ncbi:MAG TPA: hypothetical protein VFA94_07060 [Acidimicrobiales bacterium]|nr:hypothetical protein [Acidimicrobiales bacterium]
MSTPHPDDEALSAALDGEDTADVAAAAHAVTCDRCRARLAEFDAVRAAVAAPVAPADQVARARAIAAALDVSGASPAPGDDIGLAPPRRKAAAPRPSLLAAAAVLVALAVAVPLLVDRGRSSPSKTSTAASSGASAIDGGDLGSQQDPQALLAVVRSAVNENGRTAAGAADSSGPFAGNGAASTTTAGAAAAAPTTGTPSAAEARTNKQLVGTPPCQSATRETYGKGLGPLAYTATLTWQGQPAVLLAYRLSPPSGSFQYRAFVVARSSCELLTVLSL